MSDVIITPPHLDSIICGDNVEIMKQMPDACIDLTVTSPPYDNLRIYGGDEWNLEGVVDELFRTTKKGGVVVWIVGDATINGSETGSSFRQALRFVDTGFALHDTMIYQKGSGMTLNHNRYEQDFEYMFVFSKGRPSTFNPIKIPCLWHGKEADRTGQAYRKHNEINDKTRSGKERSNIKPEKIKGNIWSYNTGYGHTSKDKITFEHPAPFPEHLAADHIISWSKEGDLVLDPFSGSGTTCKMAKKLGRHWIGIEVNPKYIDISNERMRQEVLFCPH